MLPCKQTFAAIGTTWQIESLEPLGNALLSDIKDCIEQFDKTYSRFRPDSLVSAVANQAGTYVFTDDSIELMQFYRALYDITDGNVTPLIGSTLVNAGYDADYSFEQKKQIALPTWDKAMSWQGATVTTYQPINIDIGAAGKGYLIDKISRLLQLHDIDEYVIDASGDLLHKGMSENIVGLEHPYDATKIIGTVEIQNASICASASNKRVWGDGMHHIFDPYTMQPVRAIVATWAIGENAMIADGIATALFFTSPEKLLEKFDFHYLRMHDDGSVDYSSEFMGELFI
ncbi:MAG: FAD:protein transferase [Candidatus Saccharibacteria bacterium]|jgi:thiamine biosynthesis lipoprotein|nr:FAD:protein transferase [Candidatus Saccharibacteria bacterium]